MTAAPRESRQPPPDRSVDVALAEFTALRTEILGHSTSQNTVLGLGTTAIGVLLGLAINNPAQRGLLVLVPVVCAILILIYSGLAYRIVVAGNYVELELWPYLSRRARAPDLPSWEKSLSGLESRWPHRYLSQIVELSLVVLLLGIGLVAAHEADEALGRLRDGAAGLLIAATLAGAWLGRRRRLGRQHFRPRTRR